MFARTLTRSIARRPMRFAIAVLAVAMGVGMAVALASVSLVLGDRLGRTVRQYGANLVLVPKGAEVPLEVAGNDFSAMIDAGAIPDTSLATLRTFRWRNNILAIAPQMNAGAGVRFHDESMGQGIASFKRIAVPMVGTWFAHTAAGQTAGATVDGMKALAPWWKVAGRLPNEDSNEILVGRVLAEKLGVVSGDNVIMPVGNAPFESLPVAGVVDAAARGRSSDVPLSGCETTHRPGR